MKKIWYLFLVACFIIGLSGCSGNNDKTDTVGTEITPAEKALTPTEEETTPTDSLPEKQEITVTPAADNSSAEVTEIKEGSIMDIEYESKAIATNVVGDKSLRKFYIYLPPSYETSEKKYPVVYFLHGYGDSPNGFLMSYKNSLDKEFSNGAKEFILVALDGNNKSGGSFYVNSPVAGNWEDYVVEEVVAYMDQNYRTIADSASRGMSGYSMGGFGALYLALRHPDVFNSTMVFCPGVFAEDDLDSVLLSWQSWFDVKRSYAQAFSPDQNNTKFYGNIISDADIEAKNTVWKNWMDGYSNWGQKLEDYLALNTPLAAIEINYSEADSFSWIPGGCQYLAELMKEKNISYTINKFDGGHIVPRNAMEVNFVPFFGEHLTYDE